MKDLYILGSCGSIGLQTLDIVRKNKDSFKVIGISVGSDLCLANKIIDEFNPLIVCVKKEEDKNYINNKKIKLVFGDFGLLEIAKYKTSLTNENILVNALVGSAGLKPTIEAIKTKKNIALANKETLVMAGEIINNLVKEYNVLLHPIDSEHSAIWQCLQGEKIDDVKSIIITASGGAFRDKTLDELKYVTKEMALNHPNWKMGKKITIDSATMMNKGFEVIEAYFLFNLEVKKIKTIMHKESIIHSLVEFNDNTIKAQLGTPDMRIPIMYALMYPKHNFYNELSLDLLKVGKLSFDELSFERFKCLKLAYLSLEKGKIYPCVLNASNEACVNLFLNDKISFLQIEQIVEEYMNKEYKFNHLDINEVINCNNIIYNEIIKKYGGFN